MTSWNQTRWEKTLQACLVEPLVTIHYKQEISTPPTVCFIRFFLIIRIDMTLLRNIFFPSLSITWAHRITSAFEVVIQYKRIL